MNIEPYITLIQNMPFNEQAFIPNVQKWNQILATANIQVNMQNYNNGFSRFDICNLELNSEKIIKILMWGYPTGGRGNNIINVLNKRKNIIAIINEHDNPEIARNEIYEMITELDNIHCLGRSTWSKFLYFSNIRYLNNRLLILDDKIERLLNNCTVNGIIFSDIDNKGDYNSYLLYLDKMNELKNLFDIDDVSKLELFFFIFGDVLRLRFN